MLIVKTAVIVVIALSISMIIGWIIDKIQEVNIDG